MSLLEQQAVLEAPRLSVRTWAHDVYMVFWREIRRFVGQRMRILALVAQPIIWLVFMGNMLQGLTAEFAASALLGTDSYVAFMLPGIVVMTALFAGLFSGMSVAWERRFGFLQKMMASPIPREAIPLGKMAAAAVQGMLQVVIILGLGLLMGVRLATGLPGLVAVLLLSGLFALAMAGFSLALAAVLRTHEALMAVINFFTLPLIFTSDAMFPRAAMPGWLAAIARINPVSWAVGPVRDLVLHGWNWPAIAAGVVALLLVAGLMTRLATRELEKSVV